MFSLLKKVISESRRWANFNRVLSSIVLMFSLFIYIELLSRGGAYGFDSPFIYESLIVIPCLFFLIILSIMIKKNFFMILFWDLVILFLIYMLTGLHLVLRTRHFL